jgi:hypothetical protein
MGGVSEIERERERERDAFFCTPATNDESKSGKASREMRNAKIIFSEGNG